MTEVQDQILEAPFLSTPARKIEEDKWLRDRRAFFKMLPELLKTLRGKWVALYEEKVIEVGDSMQNVLLRFRERIPKGEVYIQLVDEKLPIAQMLSPRRGRR